MKKHLFFYLVLIIALMPPVISGAHDNPSPLVSTDWLQINLANPSVIILDVRKVEEYKEGHIPGSISLTYTAWRTREKNLDCQLPEKDELNDTLCSTGLRKYAFVVIVGKTDADRDRVNVTRVAWTLKYAGIKKPLILDGGYNKWNQEKRPISDIVRKPTKDYTPCQWNTGVLATKQQVKASLGKAAIIDTRNLKLFEGKKDDPMLKRRGHIPGAHNLPYTLVFTKEGSFEKKDILQSRASKTVGESKAREVIVLCCTGQFASSWWFVLSEMLGYKNVKIYDGSMEEWCDDKDAPLIEGKTLVPIKEEKQTLGVGSSRLHGQSGGPVWTGNGKPCEGLVCRTEAAASFGE